MPDNDPSAEAPIQPETGLIDAPVVPAADVAPEVTDAGTDVLPVHEEAEDPKEPEDSRRLWGLLTLIAIIVIVVLLLLLPRCGADDDGANSGAGKTIEPVTGYEAVPGLVSVWVTEGTDIDRVLASAGVDAVSTLDTGEGRWVVEVTVGTEAAAVEKLQDARGVYDAGLVYEQDEAAQP